ncbi:MAG: carboxypeptidase-like regulatory domain-containing protein [Acidobacteriota bacterium]
MRITNALVVSLTGLVLSSPALAQDHGRLPQSQPGTVTLTLSEYDRLLDRASNPAARPTSPPTPAVVSRAEYQARVDGAVVRGTLKADGEVFAKGPVKIHLLDGVTLLDAKADGRALPMITEKLENATVISGPARFSALIDWGVALGTAPGRASFMLPAVAAATVSGTVDLPGDPVDVRVEPGFVTRRRASSGRTLLELTMMPGQRAQVSWAVRESGPQPSPAEARMLADVKSLWRISEADTQLIALVEITMIRGIARTFELQLPAGFEVSSVNGATLETSESKGSTLVLAVRDTPARRHEFLVSAERGHEAGPFKLDTPLVSVTAAQRETGEVAIEAAGTVEVIADGDPALRRMDVREVHASLRQLAREPLLAAFRYQRRPGETRALAVDVKRFPDAPVIAAVADRAVATTLVTTEGRTLTEIAMWVRNQAQPFVKVALPPGATMLSVEVGGESARPVQGSDGLRVPLLRPGFRPNGVYPVSFVYMNAGSPFEKRGDARMTLAAIDLPIGMLEWELFVPDQYSMKSVAGNVIPAAALGEMAAGASAASYGSVGGVPPGYASAAARGEIVGHVVDSTGAVIPGATITLVAEGVRRTAVSDAKGVYVLSGVPSGPVTVTAELAGFNRVERRLNFDQRPRLVDFRLDVSSLTETVTVSGEAPVIDTKSSERGSTFRPSDQRAPAAARTTPPPTQEQEASQNVLNLQRRVAGVLPVRIDVPRTGTSHRFVRPLVLGDETEVSLKYKRR